MTGDGSWRSSQRLQSIVHDAPERRPNVRTLARFASNTQCRLASLGFIGRVDFDKLLDGTSLAVPFGQSPFALRRGTQFEERLRKDGHRPILQLLSEGLGVDVSGARVVNLRNGFAHSRAGMEERAKATAELVGRVLRGEPDAPNLIDGAVLCREIAGVRSFFEADAVAARFGGPVHTGEIKSFPTVDGQADPDKVGAAMAQASIYILLLKDLVESLGGRRDVVSAEALLITPKNVGLEPTMSKRDVGREIERANRILRAAPSADELVDGLPDRVPTFAEVADKKAPEPQRVEAALCLAEKVGTRYQPECMSACGLSRLCRKRVHDSGDLARLGGQVQRLLPSVGSLDRAHELVQGAKPLPAERGAAEQLLRARRLMDDLLAVEGHAPSARPSPKKAAAR